MHPVPIGIYYHFTWMYVLKWIDLVLNAFSVPKVAFSGLLPWWRHQMETFSALLAICAGNSPVPGEFPIQRPVTRSFDVFFDLRSNKRLSKQWRGWWFETQSYPLWHHRNVHGRIRCSISHHSMYPQNSMTPPPSPPLIIFFIFYSLGIL